MKVKTLTRTQRQVISALGQTFVCPGAKECGVDKCAHFYPHTQRDGCDNGCFKSDSCVSLAQKYLRLEA